MGRTNAVRRLTILTTKVTIVIVVVVVFVVFVLVNVIVIVIVMLIVIVNAIVTNAMKYLRILTTKAMTGRGVHLMSTQMSHSLNNAQR